MKVAVVGGGYAGMAAAVTLAEAGIPVTVFEAARDLGGRARRVVSHGIPLDNGLHILIGAYRETLRLIERVNLDAPRAFMRFPLDLHLHRRLRLRAPPWPAPLHLAAAVLGARGAPFRERMAALRFVRRMRAQAFELARDTTVRALLEAHAQGETFVRYFWNPLCLAALNTSAERASAQIFLNVLRESLGGARNASDILLARSDLSALFPEPASRFVRERGGDVVTGVAVDALSIQRDAVVLKTKTGIAHFDHVVCAVSPARVATLISSELRLAQSAAQLARFSYRPIYSVYLQFTRAVRLPGPMIGLAGLAQWVFDRDAICGQHGLVGAVISGAGAHEAMTNDVLAHAVHEELEREFGALPPLAWHRVIAEKRATFECTPGLERPSTRTALPNVHLAGDYTASDFPATLESAVRSGIAAASQVLDERSQRDRRARASR